jgi:HK97 family phage major capsid protein
VCSSDLGVKSQTEGTNSEGGFTVPEIVSSSLIWLRNEQGIARRYSRIYPMTSDVLNVPNASTSTTTYYPGEATAITASDITFTQVALTAKKLAILTIVSKELNEDTVIDFGATLAQDFAYGLALAEDAAAFQGDGTSTYGSITGIMPKIKALSATYANIASMVVGASGSSSALSSLTLANWQSMVAKLQPYATNPRWFMHKSVFYNGCADKLIALGGNAIMDIQNAYGTEPTLFGIPISFVQNMPSATGASVDLAVLGDLSKGVAFGDRRGVSVEVSDQVKFIEDALTFKATERYAFNAFDVGNVNATVASQVPGSLIVLQASAS